MARVLCPLQSWLKVCELQVMQDLLAHRRCPGKGRPHLQQLRWATVMGLQEAYPAAIHPSLHPTSQLSFSKGRHLSLSIVTCHHQLLWQPFHWTTPRQLVPMTNLTTFLSESQPVPLLPPAASLHQPQQRFDTDLTVPLLMPSSIYNKT